MHALQCDHAFPGVRLECPVCGESSSFSIAQRIDRHGGLTWSESVACPQCQTHQEADGWGFPPAGIRAVLLGANGVWTVRLKLGGSLTRGVRQLSRVIQGGSGDLYRALKNADWVFMGTALEAAWVAGEGEDFEIVMQAGGDIDKIAARPRWVWDIEGN
jgi:hypothetical protein